MSQDDPGNPRSEILALMHQARSGALATLLDGGPYVSLVDVAPDADGEPILLLSRLAWHTRNIATDPRASLLFTRHVTESTLAGARVSLIGSLAPGEEAELRNFYLIQHPEAARYADFGDFSFYRFSVAIAHYVAGFGRIVTFARRQLFDESED